jgi:hypothetical protein
VTLEYSRYSLPPSLVPILVRKAALCLKKNAMPRRWHRSLGNGSKDFWPMPHE